MQKPETVYGLSVATGSPSVNRGEAVAKNLYACNIIASRDIERVAKQINAAINEELGTPATIVPAMTKHVIEAPAVCCHCKVRYESPTTGYVMNVCHCGHELFTVTLENKADMTSGPR